MKKANTLVIAVALAAPMCASAAIEKMWPESIFLNYDQGGIGFATIVGLQHNRISITSDGSTAVVTTAYDLVNGDYNAGPVDAYRFNADGMANIIGSLADRAFISGDGTTAVYREGAGALKSAPAIGGGTEQTVIGGGGRNFSVSNDFTKIAYVSGTGAASMVMTADIDGSNAVMVHTVNPNAVIEIVKISGNGSKVIISEGPDGEELTPKPPELFVVDSDGNNKVQLTDGAGEGATSGSADMIRGADITDDGSVVVFAKTWQPGIFKINSDKTDLVQLFNLAAEWPKISGDGSTVAFVTKEQSDMLGSSSDSGFLTPYSFPVASPSQIKAHVPFGLGIVRGWDVDWIDVSQNGEWVIYTSGDDFFGSNPTRDFNNVYFYRSNGASASGSTGIVPGGIGTETDTDVTSLDRVTIALLFLALGAAMLRATRPRVPIRKRTER